MRKLPASRSLEWIRTALSCVGARPMVFVTMGLVMLMIAMLPVLGTLIMLLLGPALTAGLIHAAREQSQGRMPQVGQLFRVFQDGERVASYIALCLPFFAAILVLTVFAIPLVMYGLHTGTLTQQMTSDPPAMQAALKQLLLHSAGGMLYLLVILVVLVLIGMLTFLATPIILLQRRPAFEAMKRSFLACRRNFGPFIVTMLLSGVALQIVSSVLGLALPAWLASSLVSVLYYAALGPLTYAMYGDIFGEEGAAPANAPDASAKPGPDNQTLEA